MTALVITSWMDGLSLIVAVPLVMAFGVLLPHLGAYRPAKDAAKRVIAALLFASIVGTIGATVVRADDDDFVMLNPCANLTPGDVEWWLRGCIFLPRRRSVRRRAGRTS
jgi:hypothetical protein